MRGVAGKEGWRWLFLVEGEYLSALYRSPRPILRNAGIFTLVIGILTFFLLPASPTQTKKSYRPHGWFTDREEVIMVNRIIRDDPSKGGMHNRQALSLRMLLKSLTDWDVSSLLSLLVELLDPSSRFIALADLPHWVDQSNAHRTSPDLSYAHFAKSRLRHD